MKKVCRFLFPILALAWLMFIFGNSFLDAEQSSQISSGYTDMAVDIIEDITDTPVDQPQRDTITTVIRKMAHCLEFMLLSILTFLAFTVNGLSVKEHLFFHLFLGLSVGLMDETIQRMSEGRTSSVVDVYIDFAGFALGICLCLLLRYLHSQRKEKKQTE